jgi:hypothetical protein
MSKPRSVETSEELQNAMYGDRKTALRFFRRMAEGKDDFETKIFSQFIAARILEADCTKGRRRPDALVRALSLSGTTDKNREMRDIAENINGLAQFDNAKHPVVGNALIKFIEQAIAAGRIRDVGDVPKTLRNELTKQRRKKKG